MRVIYRLETIKERLRPVFEAYPVNRATLFGSYARGDMTPESDLDIVLECDKIMWGLRFYAAWADLENAIGKPIDLIEAIELKQGTSIHERVQNEGVVIYERVG